MEALTRAGLLDETDAGAFRIYSGTCPACSLRQNLAVPVGQVAKCIGCHEALPVQVGTA